MAEAKPPGHRVAMEVINFECLLATALLTERLLATVFPLGRPLATALLTLRLLATEPFLNFISLLLVVGQLATVDLKAVLATITHAQLPSIVQPVQRILVHNGTVILEVAGSGEDHVTQKEVNNSELSEKKNVNVTGVKVYIPVGGESEIFDITERAVPNKADFPELPTKVGQTSADKTVAEGTRCSALLRVLPWSSGATEGPAGTHPATAAAVKQRRPTRPIRPSRG